MNSSDWPVSDFGVQQTRISTQEFCTYIKKFHPIIYAHQKACTLSQVGTSTINSSIGAHLRRRRNIRNSRQLEAALIEHDGLARCRAIIWVGDAVALDGRAADVHRVGPVRGAFSVCDGC
jgi:hypothetical protein